MASGVKWAGVLDVGAPYTCSLSSEVLIKAEKELEEKAEWRDRDVLALRFLRAKKFDYDQALQEIRNYYRVRYSNPEVFHDLLPSSSIHVFNENGCINFLSTIDYRGCRILFIDMGKWKPECLSVDELMRGLFLILEMELLHEPTQVHGICVIMDLRTLGVSQVVQHLKPAVIKKIFHTLQNAFPIRLKAVHLVHESTLLDVILTMVKPFMTEKLRQRLHFHGSNTSSLHLHMDLEQLPVTLGGGGREGSGLDRDIVDRLRTSHSYFAKLNQFGYNQSPPPGGDQPEGSPLRSVLHSYKRFCIDGLNH